MSPFVFFTIAIIMYFIYEWLNDDDDDINHPSHNSYL
jgi:hypothetical protein